MRSLLTASLGTGLLAFLLAAPAHADVALATVGPMTGAYAIFGAQMQRGATWMVKRLNDNGGVLGQKVDLQVGDDACDPKQAVAVANRLSQSDVAAVIGHYCSGSSIPASAVYADADILQISPASTNPSFTDDAAARGWTNIFRTCGRDDKQGVTAGDFVATRFGTKRIAVLHDKSAYGKGLADEMKAELNKRDVHEVLYDSYNAGEKDYSALITRLKGLAAEVVYIGGYHTEVGLILRQARSAGYAAQFMSGDANASDELYQIAGAASDGFLMTFGPDPRKNPAAIEVVKSMRAEGFEPEGYTLYTVAAVQVWAAAAKAAASTATDKVAAKLHGGTFDTVVGPLTFDEKGDIEDPKYVVYVWQGGSYAELQD